MQAGNSALQSGNSANHFDHYEKYPIAVLRGPKEHLPSDVDPLAKEVKLVLGISRSTVNVNESHSLRRGHCPPRKSFTYMRKKLAAQI